MAILKHYCPNLELENNFILEENNKLRYNDPIHALYMTTAAC
jgi:hypothetical protein